MVLKYKYGFITQKFTKIHEFLIKCKKVLMKIVASPKKARKVKKKFEHYCEPPKKHKR